MGYLRASAGSGKIIAIAAGPHLRRTVISGTAGCAPILPAQGTPRLLDLLVGLIEDAVRLPVAEAGCIRFPARLLPAAPSGS